MGSIFENGELARRADKIAMRLAEKGEAMARAGFETALYDGENDTAVSVEKTSEGYAITASGESVLFIEFGSGVTEGYGHPQADEMDFGPGTWSDGPEGKGHWNDPGGWHIPGTGKHTYGNPPAMAMYNTAKEVRRSIPRVVSEVFSE